MKSGQDAFSLAALARPYLVLGKTTKADMIHTDMLNVGMFTAGNSGCSKLSEMMVGYTLKTVGPGLVCPALKETDEDFHRITQTDFEVMKEFLQHKSFVLDPGVVEEYCAYRVKSRLVEYSWNNSERLLARSYNRAHGQTLSCSLSIVRKSGLLITFVLGTKAVEEDHGYCSQDCPVSKSKEPGETL